MSAVQQQQDVYFADFAALEKRLGASDPPWLRPIRKAALDRFAELGFPATKMEEWKYTNVAPIAAVPFRPVSGRSSISAPQAQTVKERFVLAEGDSSRLVFVDGQFNSELSSTASLPPGVIVASLAEALARGAPGLEAHLARYAGYQNHAFVALNTAFIEQGAFVEVPRETVLRKPVDLLFVATARTGGGTGPVVSHYRNLIVVGRGSQATIVERYVGLEEERYFTNAVTELVAGEGAIVDYVKAQQESERAFHVATLQAEQGRSSRVSTCSVAFGGALAREEVKAVLNGEGSESTLHGLYVIRGLQHVDNHTTIDHAKPHCASRELYKGVLDGASTGVFNGKIIVRKDAQKTDSKQSNKNLLLSENAVINTKPQLEIYADDVKCTHGATIGQIDQEAVFYLRSRGIGLDEARAMLTQAFAGDVIGKITFEPLRERLKDALLARLAKSSGGVPAEGESQRVSTIEEG